MKLYHIPFDIEKALNIINDTEQYVIDDIVRFHIIVVASNMDEYKNNKSFLSNTDRISLLPTIIGKYGSTINDANFVQCYNNTDIHLKDGFWDMINKYKVYQRISPEVFAALLNGKVKPYVLFSYKEIVCHFDKQCLDFMKSNSHLIEMLLSNVFENNYNNPEVYFPKSLTPEMKGDLIKEYIKSTDVNPNYLRLIYNAKDTKEFPISDEVRLLAQRRFHEWWDHNTSNASTYGYGVSVAFISSPDCCANINRDGRDIKCEFSKEWITNNLDYATLLNNFIYLFGYCDFRFRSEFVSLKHDASTLEAAIGLHNKTDYMVSLAFDLKNMLFSAEMSAYYHELLIHDINIENIFKWFFEIYLPTEFNAEGFYYLQSSDKTSYLEKCILLSCTIDSVLKQFNMYCLNKYIDRELIEISSKPLLFSDVSSLVEKKYIYASSKCIDRECNLLFSDQSLLTYTDKTKERYHDLPTMLTAESMTVDNYELFQRSDIEWLISRGTLWVDGQGVLNTNKNRTVILKEIFDKEVICYSYVKDNHKLIDKLIDCQNLSCESSLFSKPEQDYLDYMLNNSKFGNGPALRNNYVHGTYPLDSKKNEQNYYELLKIMILIIIKINEEFCLRG